tara:strand:- start:3220 stop:3516 length:297 start_codon:yes stop_codon:yes gene_type:complete
VNRKHAALKRKVVRLAGDWRDPHDQDTWATRDIVQNIEVEEDGEVTITVKPNRPHCPCCLIDLDLFKQKLSKIKGVTFTTLNVVGVPASDRWNRTLNR